jgi:anaerobic C4-dicarboxylate transporter
MRILSTLAILLLSGSAAFAADMPVAAAQPLQVSANQLVPVQYAPQAYYAQPVYAAPQQAVRPVAAPVPAEAQNERKVDIMWMNSY